MIKKFICWLWGHQYVGGFHFEKIQNAENTGYSFYRYGQRVCPRCGVKNVEMV